MSLHVETLHTSYLMVRVIDPATAAQTTLEILGIESDEQLSLLLEYDEAVVITGDLRKFADMVNAAVSKHERLVTRQSDEPKVGTE
jgi:hypothetical protein